MVFVVLEEKELYVKIPKSKLAVISWVWYPKHKEQKEKKKTNRYIGLCKKQQQQQKLCVSKGTTDGVKRQPTQWENLFAHHISDKNPEH